MPGTTERPTIKKLPLDALTVDKRYQRPLHERKVAEIVADFSPALCGVLRVAGGSNGTYPVYDGQHRLAALKLLGETHWWCWIIPGLTPVQAADAFVRTQTERRPVHPIDRHMASVFAGDELSIKVNNLVEAAGYRITGKDVHGSLACVAALYHGYSTYGAKHLTHALKLIEKAWGLDDRYARKAGMVGGMTLLMAKRGDVMDLESFSERLAGTMAGQVLAGAKSAVVGSLGTTDRVRVARALLEIYNHKRSSGRIPPTGLGRGA